MKLFKRKKYVTMEEFNDMLKAIGLERDADMFFSRHYYDVKGEIEFIKKEIISNKVILDNKIDSVICKLNRIAEYLNIEEVKEPERTYYKKRKKAK